MTAKPNEDIVFVDDAMTWSVKVHRASTARFDSVNESDVKKIELY
jgi:hypothetical protein